MEPATLLLVRHAHAAAPDADQCPRLSGWYDLPLSPAGLRQLGPLQQKLRGAPAIAALYSSPLRRAHMTAAAAGGALGLPVRLMGSLREISCGRLEGMPIEEVRARYAALWDRHAAQRDPDFRWPDGESYRELRRRAWRAVFRIAAAHPAQRVVVVTHAGVITQLMGALAGVSAARWESFRVGNASLTELQLGNGGARIARVDD